MLEIEIKSLLGNQANCDAFLKRLNQFQPQPKLIDTNSQLNHYFHGGVIEQLREKVINLFNKPQQDELRKLIALGENHSVRTRQKNAQVLLVIKASIDDTTSSNGISRLEFEQQVEISLEKLDALVLAAGFEYQAKWSRDRQLFALVYQSHDVEISIDRNAGYGYLAEFEIQVDNPQQVDQATTVLRQLMTEIGAQELAQDRLERMFAHYNEHWSEYYGTNKTFTVE